MNSFGQNNKQKKQQQGNTNPFANALVESEKKSSSGNKTNSNNLPLTKLLGENNFSGFNEDFMAREKANFLEEEKRNSLRKKLHDKVNPIETHQLFRAKEEKNKKELEQVRVELKGLIEEIGYLNKDIDMAVSQNIVSPGSETASYYTNFFHQLRQLITLLRQKVKSARTWAQEMNSKKNKRGGYFDMSKGKNVHASMNSERNFGGNSVG